MKSVHLFTMALAGAAGVAPLSAQEKRPSFCAQIPDTMLGGLAAPYARKVAPDGTAYCEGLMRAPIALAPMRIVSVKQQQEPKPQFTPGATALLRWCDEPQARIRLALRSLIVPMYAFDALQAKQFAWPADSIARWQPDWHAVAARGSREIEIGGQKYEVLLPLRIGAGYSDTYSFMVKAKLPVRLSTALIEPIAPAGPAELIKIVAARGSAADTWVTTIPFSTKKKGVFRVTLGEDVDQAGASTEPIYLLHDNCSTK